MMRRSVWDHWERPMLRGASLIKMDLRGADLYEADLTGAKLVEADLGRANLLKADLREADLYDANLRGANLRDATLVEANLSEADLRDAMLVEANLNVANLQGAHLRGANLYRACLIGADLTHAETGGTLFSDLDLSAAKGLDTVHHWGPSTLGIDTLYRSKGRISEVFLRGVGMEENLITYIPALFAQSSQYYSCFISYSWADKAFARQLHDTLQSRGIRCWLDEKQMLPGDDQHEQIDRGIRL
ncbi:MAG: toll/interleukin-1 receptor domain-containing protein [Fimbriimonadaceae bacterium]|nr:toll/interleukin-1 receptor domain-containing protein [Fimbriimonadaceae bacterium]